MRYYGDLGSDTSTITTSTSSGDTTVDLTDHWYTTHDSSSVTTPCGHVWTDGILLSPSAMTLSSDDISTSFSFDIPAGETRATMIFAVQGATRTDVQNTVDWLANNFWRRNLVTTHDPGSLFNVDLCGGFPAVILKMLVESQPGRIDLLPALPEQWPNGRVEGVCCRGQVEIENLAWTPEQIRVALRSDVTQTVSLHLPQGMAPRQVHLTANQTQTFEITCVCQAAMEPSQGGEFAER